MAEQQAPKRTTPRGWFFLAVFFGLLGVGGWGIATHNGLYEGIGFLPILLALLIFMIRNDRRAKRDPEYARELSEQQEKGREKRQAEQARSWARLVNLAGWISVALVVVFLNDLQYVGWDLSATPLKTRAFMVVIGAAAALTLINCVQGVLRRRAS